MFEIRDVPYPVVVDLEPGVYSADNLPASGKTYLYNLLREYRILGYPVYSYSFLEGTDTDLRIPEGTKLVMLDEFWRTDMSKYDFSKYKDTIILIDIKNKYIRDLEYCFFSRKKDVFLIEGV